jgi:ligand-binding sensor domain-containing protein/two-component sensor histidine kinase
MTTLLKSHFLILCLVTSPSLWGAQPRVSSSPLSKLIAQPIITTVLRDQKGLLWVGTQEGLYKFDGANLVVFNSDGNNDNWIPASNIRGISEDGEGRILVATYGGGLLEWDPYSQAFNSALNFDSTGNSQLTTIYAAQQGSVWIGTKDKILLYDGFNQDAGDWLASPMFTETIGKPYAFLEATPGELFVGSNQGLSKISTTNRTVEKYDLSALEDAQSFGVTALTMDNQGNLIIGTDTATIALIEATEGRIINQKTLDGDHSKTISAFSFYDEKLVVATDRGLYLVKTDLSYIEDISHQGAGLSSSDVLSLNLDDDLVWVGTYNGLDLLSLAPFELFNTKNSGVHNDVLSIEQDAENNIWVGTFNGLFLYDESSKTHISAEKHFGESLLIDKRITSLATSQNKLWIGFARGGVQVLDTITGASSVPNIENGNEIFSMNILIDDESQSVWIATQEHGLIRITPDETYNFYENESLLEQGILLVHRRPDSLLIVSTTNRIYEYDYGSNSFSILPIDFGFGLDNTSVFSVLELGNGDIWFGTKDHGLFLWPASYQAEGNLHPLQLGKDTEIEYSTIYGIASDSSGNLWCSSQNGIFKLDSMGQLVKKFTLADGLQGSDFSFGASFTSKSGLIYFGGMNGYNRFDPMLVEIDNSASPMRLTDISLPGQHSRHLGEFSELTSLQLTHKDYSVTFQFSVLDFIDAEKNQYRFKLEGFDSGWIENGTRNTATYTNLPPEKYVLRVQGANSAGIWNREGITLNVEMLPAPWNTWWAYLTYCVGLIILAWASLRIYRSYVVERRSAELAKEMFEAENRADDDLQEQMEIQDEIVFSSYKHSLTTLSLVSDFVSSKGINLSDELKSNVTESSIRRISALTHLEECLSFHAGTSVANLQKYTDSILADLLQSAPVNPETIITINQVSSMGLPAELASHIALIIYEILENSVQHAFDKNSPANYIQVSLTLTTDEESSEKILEIIFSDNGIGVPDDIAELASEGSGIYIVDSIIAKFDGTLEFSGASGTRVTITIPYDGETY